MKKSRMSPFLAFMSMMLAITPVLVLAATGLNVAAKSLPYFDPQGSDRTSWNYAVHGAGSIPRELGEKLLIRDQDHVFAADSLVGVVNKEYSVVREQLRRLLAEKMGIAEEHDSVAGPIPKPQEERPPYLGTEWQPWPPLGEGLTVFKDAGRQFPLPREYQFTSRPYNRLESAKGFSEVRIRVTDGKELLGKDVTVIQVRRRDYSREWARLHGGLPLPKKENRAYTLVTNTEVVLIEQLTQREPGWTVRYFLPDSSHHAPGSRPMLSKEYKAYNEEFLASMMSAVKQF